MCIYFPMFKPQSPSKYSPFDAIYLSRCFFHYSKQFLNSSMLMPFSASAIFCFTFSTLAKSFPLRTVLIWGNQKILLGVRSGEQGGWGMGSCCFGSKTAEHSARCRQVCSLSHLTWNEQMHWKGVPKNIICWSQTRPLTTMPASVLIQMGS